jgi:hypothetical protein
LRFGAKRRLFLLLKEEWGIMEWEDDMQDACEGTSDGDYDDTREEEDEEEDAEEEEEEEEDEEEDIISDCDDHDLQPISMLPQVRWTIPLSLHRERERLAQSAFRAHGQSCKWSQDQVSC